MVHYKKIARLLEDNLKNSAFRRGISANHLGLIQQGISDHLPIMMETKNFGAPLNIISWNLLADIHLYNNFKNISGSLDLYAHLNKDNVYGGSRSKLDLYFSELGSFLNERKGKSSSITVDQQLLKDFNSFNLAASRLIPSLDLHLPSESLEIQKTHREKQIKALERSRADIATILLDKEHLYAHEFELAIQQCVDLTYHIEDPSGALKWKNRLKQLLENKLLLKALSEADFLCFQECTNPIDIHRICPEKTCIKHKVSKHTDDHCALFYDSHQYDLVGEAKCFALENNKKPCLMARFRNKATGQDLIIGSIHHPGGHENHIREIVEQLKDLGENSLPTYILGDYNHTERFFESSLGDYEILFPKLGTMAGGDYGNTNLSIDAVLTNTNRNHLEISRLPMMACPPALMPTKVRFKDEDSYRPNASESFEPPVQRCVSADEVINSLEPSSANYGPRIGF